MRIPVTLTYAEVEKRHPQELKRLIEQLRKSKSKQKDADPTGMTFEYNYAMRCEGFTGAQVLDHLSGVKPLPERKKFVTVEEKVADWMERATPVNLTGKLGRWYGCERVPNPPELEENFRLDAEREVAEEQRRASLTDEEREAETQEILRQLSGMGGFVGFRIG